MYVARLRFLGCCAAFASAICWAVQGMFFKLIHGIYYQEIVMCRAIFLMMLAVLIVVYRKEAYLLGQQGQLKWLSALSLCLSADLAFRFYAITLMPFADVLAITMSSTMFLTLIGGRCLLKETCAVFEVIVSSLIIVGILLVILDMEQISQIFVNDSQNDTTIAVPTTEMSYEATTWEMVYNATNKLNSDKGWRMSDTVRDRLIGSVLAVLSSVCSAGFALILRTVTDIHYSVTMLHGSVWSILVAVLMTSILGTWTVPSTTNDGLYLLGFGVVGTLAMLTLFLALFHEEAGAVCTIRTAEIPISYVLQIVFMNQHSSIYIIIGATIVTLCSTSYGVRAWHRQYVEDPTKEHLLKK